jgi:phosphate transport system substrate-binding protein
MTKRNAKLGARAALMALALTAAACAKAPETADAGPQPVRIDGSSTVFPLTEAVAQDYRAANADTPEIALVESGTTAGLAKLCAGEIDIAGASRPINSAEMVACLRGQVSYVEVPVAFDGVTVIVHPTSKLRSITLAQLRAIWGPEAQGGVMTWRAADARWPDEPLKLYGPTQESGTFDYFTEVVNGQARASRTDYTATEDDLVIVEGVAATPGAMGYLGLAYYERNKERLAALAIDAGEGPVAPSAETVLSGAYHPLSRPIFFYVNVKALDRPEVANFARFYVANAGRFAADVGYIPLPESAYAEYLDRIVNKRFGTAFGGRVHTGETIDEVIARPLAEAAGT